MKKYKHKKNILPLAKIATLLMLGFLLFSLIVIVKNFDKSTYSKSQAIINTGNSNIRVMYPLYNYPQWYNPATYIWDDVAANGSLVGLISIVNPANGPGSASDPNTDYRRGLDDLKLGSQIIGYVYTSYGNRTEASIKTDIDLWKNNYSQWVTGIFFDEVSTDCSKVAWYSNLVAYARSQGFGTTVLNPGVSTNECYLQAELGQIVMFENTQGQWQLYVPPAWMSNYQADKFVTLVHGASRANLTQNIQLAQQRNFGWVFFTDDVMPNPWDALPSYWTEEVSSVVSANSSSTPMPTQTPMPSLTPTLPATISPTATQQPTLTPTTIIQTTATPTRISTPTPTRIPTPPIPTNTLIPPTVRPNPTVSGVKASPTVTLRPSIPTTSSRCQITGCSNEICSDRPRRTACVLKPEYQCLQKYATCLRIDGQCQWLYSEAYHKCVEIISQTTPTPSIGETDPPISGNDPRDLESFIRMLSNRNLLELFLEFLKNRFIE